jgi:hypothetical protein
MFSLARVHVRERDVVFSSPGVYAWETLLVQVAVNSID